MRIVIKKDQGPKEVKIQNSSIMICMCGLSKNHPFCDGSHKKTLDENTELLYKYDEQGNRKELETNCQDNCCRCCKK
jgi:CDGSH iron-sulfur domain-containing protein 3